MLVGLGINYWGILLHHQFAIRRMLNTPPVFSWNWLEKLTTFNTVRNCTAGCYNKEFAGFNKIFLTEENSAETVLRFPILKDTINNRDGYSMNHYFKLVICAV